MKFSFALAFFLLGLALAFGQSVDVGIGDLGASADLGDLSASANVGNTGAAASVNGGATTTTAGTTTIAATTAGTTTAATTTAGTTGEATVAGAYKTEPTVTTVESAATVRCTPPRVVSSVIFLLTRHDTTHRRCPQW
jgi:hypothetical protein